MAILADTVIDGNLHVNGSISLGASAELLDSLLASTSSADKLGMSHSHGSLSPAGALTNEFSMDKLRTGYVIAVCGPSNDKYYIGRSLIAFGTAMGTSYALSNYGEWTEYRLAGQAIAANYIIDNSTPTSSDGDLALFNNNSPSQLVKSDIHATLATIAGSQKITLSCNITGSATSAASADAADDAAMVSVQNSNEINFRGLYDKMKESGGNHDIWFNYVDGSTGQAKSGVDEIYYKFGQFNGPNITNVTLVANHFTGTATNSTKWNGYSLVVGSYATNPNTIYFI